MATDEDPVWSPDGAQIAFDSNRDGSVNNLYQKNSGGAGEERLLLKTDKNKFAQSWSSDGKYVVYDEVDSQNSRDVWALPLTGDGKPIPVVKTPADEFQGQLSPDSKWIAYTASETSRPEVYIQSFPPSGSKYQISNTGGTQPRWQRNGKELLFLTLTSELMAVGIETGPGSDKSATLRAGLPKKIMNTSVLRRSSKVTALCLWEIST
jgi:Tol biopolymer transport system component